MHAHTVDIVRLVERIIPVLKPGKGLAVDGVQVLLAHVQDVPNGARRERADAALFKRTVKGKPGKAEPSVKGFASLESRVSRAIFGDGVPVPASAGVLFGRQPADAQI